LTQLSEQARTRALERFQLLRLHLEDGVPLARVARERGIALRTTERWLRQYRQDGLLGLARKVHANRGQRRLSPELQRLIEGLALRRPALSVAVIHRQAGTVAKERGWAIPSYACVHAIVRALDPALVTLAQAGPKAYGEQYDLLYRREASHPNEIWQADHLDNVTFRNQPSEGLGWRTLMRQIARP
jgi:putative transposase